MCQTKKLAATAEKHKTVKYVNSCQKKDELESESEENNILALVKNINTETPQALIDVLIKTLGKANVKFYTNNENTNEKQYKSCACGCQKNIKETESVIDNDQEKSMNELVDLFDGKQLMKEGILKPVDPAATPIM
ncbi:conserved hypothetical protein [Trichinella spiralis]|uniref:hypothetical protein n=1 Tax=Trichinella spiralis TaxID=6334 RepID=UPI0001EFB89B|nr:conserved hypothetical protein [Trichinella spiralis]